MLIPHLAPEMLQKLKAVLAEKRQCRLPGMSCSATAFLALSLLREFRRSVVVVSDSMHSLDELLRNLLALTPEHTERTLYYPAWESLPGKQAIAQPEVLGERLQALARLTGLNEPVVIATCVQALMQPALSPAALKANTVDLALNKEYDPQVLAERLEHCGYAFEPEVQEQGQAALRGALLDVWPPDAENPFRIEFFGSRVETIRSFDPADQRSCTRLNEATLPPANEWSLAFSGIQARCPFLDYLPRQLIYLWSEPLPYDFQAAARGPTGIRYHVALYQEALAEHTPQGEEADVAALTVSFAQVCQMISENPQAWQCWPAPGFESTSSVEREAESGKRKVGPDADWPPPAELVDLGFQSVSALAAPRFGLLAPDVFAEQRRQWLARLQRYAQHCGQANLAERARAPQSGLRVHIFFYTQGALDRFRELYPQSNFHLQVGELSDGFLHSAMQLAVLSESNLLGRAKLLPERARRTPRAAREGAGETITDWTSLQPGDLVVHVDHGIGRFLGLKEIIFPSYASRLVRRSPDSPSLPACPSSARELGQGGRDEGGLARSSPDLSESRDEGGNGKLQEVLAIEYAEGVKLYVPVAQAHLLSRYVGTGHHAPPLHRLGSARWTREKDAAERAVADLAAGLLEVQAQRESMSGFSFPPDTPWQHEFEAAFPYQETLDQERAIQAVKRDMENSRPMDRLVCGDVGYGKTEVALRAAFKCVMSGKQVAVLAPTTVLAQQHYEVFSERIAAYPMRVKLLCRFQTAAEQAAIVRALANGEVDMVIGTHRLLQPDVRFKELGLVIVDEEQRFGVGHKEHFKQFQQLVDVLTLTATPIPRTLYLGLTGAREISMIQTSPKARLSIATIVAKNDDHLVRDAILRELNRGGQVYYLHNRVHSIERVRTRLEKLVPEARLAVGHGQMPTSELSHIIRDFARGDYDVLLCTTIIESGLDIPNVNTILIDRADRFGLADLYQLRGRVGRSSRQAYAYLLLPVAGQLLDGSRQRLQAILQHTELGAGFRLAMHDLEIRGAGNLLGPEQSGYIAAIGFDLYCQLLRYTIAQLSPPQADPPTAEKTPSPTRIVNVEVALDFLDLSTHPADSACAAFLPVTYVEDERLRLSVYRQIASAMTLPELSDLRAEFRDRFGPLPPPLERLLKIAALRIQAAEKKITRIEVRSGKLILHRGNELLQLKQRFPRLRAASTDKQLDEIGQWLRRVEDAGFS